MLFSLKLWASLRAHVLEVWVPNSSKKLSKAWNILMDFNPLDILWNFKVLRPCTFQTSNNYSCVSQISVSYNSKLLYVNQKIYKPIKLYDLFHQQHRGAKIFLCPHHRRLEMALRLLHSRSQDEDGHGADHLPALARHLPAAAASSLRPQAEQSQRVPGLPIRGIQPRSARVGWQPKGLL